MIPILILAAGGSTRMRGADKLLEQVAGQPLLRLQAERALATGQPVFIALPHADHPRAAALSDMDVTPLVVPDAAEGMSATLRGAVPQLPDAPAFMLLLGDLIDIGADDLMMMLQTHRDQPDNLVWRGATEDGKPGHPILFDASLRPQFATLSGDDGARAIVAPLTARTCLVPLKGNRARRDLDTPEDWANWRRRNG